MKLPMLLAGPILRRVEISEVYIMTVTREKMDVIEAALYIPTITSKKLQYTPVNVKTITGTVKLGENIYINLSKIVPLKGAFPTDQFLCYNLIFKRKNNSFDLGNLGLLQKHQLDSIVYGDFQYPSFYIKSIKNYAPILYGSCRKPHGKGDDALAGADLLLEKTYDNLNERPQALFMMGDQIYADDVADPLIAFIKKLGFELTGYKRETLWMLDAEIAESDQLKTINKVQGRQDLVNQLAGFTSSKAGNHLIYLNEFMAMYLLSFSPDIWDLYWQEDQKQDQKQDFMTHDDKKRNKAELKQLKRFTKTIVRVRRLLANTPTYMIFDDHDVTDDWNISFEWKEKVRKSPLGKLIVANALTAYWAFQAWGNDPMSFKEDFIRDIQHYVPTLDVTSDAYTNWVNTMWEYDRWEFYAPTSPKAIFMDIRTKRQYELQRGDVEFINEGEEYQERLPRLVNKDAWKHLTNQIRSSGWQPDEKLLMISPTPVYGLEVIEKPVKKLLYPLERFRMPVRYMFDMEAWKYNRAGFRDFHRQVYKWGISEMIILSGDVHYAFAHQNTLKLKSNKNIQITQYTSSPFKNKSVGKIAGLLLNTAMRFKRLIDTCKNKLPFLRRKKTRLKSDNFSFQSTVILRHNNVGYLKMDGTSRQSWYIRYRRNKFKMKRVKSE